jgi:hypothetical protein
LGRQRIGGKRSRAIKHAMSPRCIPGFYIAGRKRDSYPETR